MHFGFAAEFGDAEAKGSPVDPDSLTEGVVGFENGSEAEGQDGGITEAAADDAGVVDGCGMI